MAQTFTQTRTIEVLRFTGKNLQEVEEFTGASAQKFSTGSLNLHSPASRQPVFLSKDLIVVKVDGTWDQVTYTDKHLETKFDIPFETVEG